MRLYVLVEGQTEEELVKRVIAPHLNMRGVWTVPFIVTTRRDKRKGKVWKGGGRWKHWSRDLHNLSAQHHGQDVRFTTLFDLYGLPEDYPDLDTHARERDTVKRVGLLEQAMAGAVGDRRLIPYLQRHEIEALVFPGMDVLERLLDPAERPGLNVLREAVANIPPEDVNDDADTAPSKRLQAAIPSYRKTMHGPLVFEATGLAALRQKCPRFDAWMAKLEGLEGVVP